jgi:ribonuclease HI
MPKTKTKYYVVWKGRQSGIFTTWDDCSAQVSGFAGAQYKAFESRTDAETAFRGKYQDFKGTTTSPARPKEWPKFGGPIRDSYAVDASCQGNPGVLEYRCVHTQTGAVIFSQGPFEQGTNNVGEFLAIVQALEISKLKGWKILIYSDSVTAMSWVKGKKCKTTLEQNLDNAELFRLIAHAERWLAENDYPNEIKKWNTEAWGEIPADYGRK